MGIGAADETAHSTVNFVKDSARDAITVHEIVTSGEEEGLG